jgi:hypothetical protein
MTWDEPTAVSDVLKSEKEGHFCRGVGVIKSGAGVLDIGTVLGRITAGAASSAAKAGGNTAGSGALTLDVTTPVLAGAQPGVYSVRCIQAITNSGLFEVRDPSGVVIGEVLVGQTFSNQIKFSIADATDFVVDDGFDVTIAAGSGKLVAYDPTAKDGSAVADSVLLHKVDATSADVAGAVILANGPAEISPAGLKWGTNVTTQAQKDAALAALAKKLILARQSA